MQRKPDAGVNEVIASILMVALVIALVIIIGSIVFGVIVIQPKSAYIPPRVEVVNYSGQQAISLYSRGGDPAVLDKGDGVEYALGIYVENSSVSSRATPDTGVKTFGPGQTLYIYYHNGEYRVTDNLTGKIFDQLPPGPLTLRLVDENARLLVYKEGLGIGGEGTVPVSPTPTCTLGTGWIIINPNNNSVDYRLIFQPGTIEVRTGTIPGNTKLFVWSQYYQEQGGSPHRLLTLSGQYQGQTSAETTHQTMCQFSDRTESYTSGSPGKLILERI
ncbi:MAG: hypothetical protein A4E39_01008 [Methanoregulaceae archaeon PtaB.Bin152]|nr:MAG: hypothetical protein A4E39_01008 [Methanoregulaceae archaeon PtaB.Bin152]